MVAFSSLLAHGQIRGGDSLWDARVGPIEMNGDGWIWPMNGRTIRSDWAAAKGAARVVGGGHDSVTERLLSRPAAATS